MYDKPKQLLIIYIGAFYSDMLCQFQFITQMRERSEFTQELIRWFLLEKRKPALQQLREGLNCLGFFDKAMECCDYQRFFVHDDKFCVNSSFIVNQLLPKLHDLKTRSSKQEEVKQTAANCLSELKGMFIFFVT